MPKKEIPPVKNDKKEEGYISETENSGTKKKGGKPPIAPEKTLEQFKSDFKEHLQQSAKVRLSYPTNRINRRLDSLARLLEGNNICTAVSFDPKNKKILIAANKIFSGSQTTNNYIKLIERAMTLLIDHHSPILAILAELSSIIAINLNQEERFAIDKIKKDLKINNEQFDTIINSLLVDLFKSGLTTKQWRDSIEDAEFEDDTINALKEQSVFSKIVAKVSRIARDFMKLRRTLYAEHANLTPVQQEMLAAIKDPKKNKIVRAGKKDLHVEMRIFEERKAQNNLDNSYIGISKLCCDHCGLAIEVVNSEETTHKIVRGKHGQGPKKWPLPTFLRQDPKLLKAYLGNSAYQAYQKLPDFQQKEALLYVESKDSSPTKMGKRSMQADSSDSDEEFGFTCSEDEIEACLQHVSYQDIWTFRTIKNNHKKELFSLLELEIPINDILNIYKQSTEKLAAMSSKKFYDFLQSDPDYNSQELFEKLSDIYDKNIIMFEDIVDDEDNLIEEYGFDDVVDQYEFFLGALEEFDEEGIQTNFYALTANKLHKENRDSDHYNSDDSQNYDSKSEHETNHFSSDNPDSNEEDIHNSDEEENNYYSP